MDTFCLSVSFVVDLFQFLYALLVLLNCAAGEADAAFEV